MKAQEIRELSVHERKDKIADLEQELFNLKFQLATGKIENPSRLRLIRRTLARIKTVQRENSETGDAPVTAKPEA
jgi:large subunit ribosomal protein L29